MLHPVGASLPRSETKRGEKSANMYAKKPSKAVERRICVEWCQVRAPVYIWYVRSSFSLSRDKDIDISIHLGAVFANLQPIPNLGAWHGSECGSSLRLWSVLWFPNDHFSSKFLRIYHAIVPILFGTYNKSTATAAEVELSKGLQTAFANFVKDPVNVYPAPNWPAYEPGHLGIAPVPTLAGIAYQGNVGFDDFIRPVQPISKVRTFIRNHPFIAEYLIVIKGWSMYCLGRASGSPPLRSLTPQQSWRIVLLEGVC